MFKKIISSILAVAMLAAVGTTVFAKEPVDSVLKEMASEVISSYFDDEGVVQPDTKLFSLGEKIPSYEYKNDTLIDFDSTNYYPVYIDSQLYGIFTVDYPDDAQMTSYSFGKMFVPEIREFMQQGNGQYAIIIDGAMGYIKNSNNASTIFGEAIQSFSNLRAESNTTLQDISNLSDAEISLNSGEIIMTLPISTSSQKAAGSSKNLSVGKWKQTATDGLCWAGTAECIGEYITKDKSYSPKSIETAMGVSPGAGGFNSDIMDALSELYYITTSELSPLSDSDVISKIDSDKPFHMAWIDYENYKGHATTCRGYNDSGSVMTVSVMDTSYGTFSTKTKNSNGEFIYKMGTYSLPWDSSVVPD